jgi:hypothetical protein
MSSSQVCIKIGSKQLYQMDFRLKGNWPYDSNQSLLRNYRLTKNDQFFTVANNEKIKIKGWGIINIFPKDFLQDVFFVENYSVNLLSIRKLATELSCEIIFKKNIMIFQDLVTKEKIGEGFFENGLYF